jgi:hypothetical protein
MDKSKAKKAVKKSSEHKKQAESQAAGALLAMKAAGGGAIDPEVQAAKIDMQPADGYVNPYHAMGAMAPMLYSAGNMLDGYNYPVMVNPEA